MQWSRAHGVLVAAGVLVAGACEPRSAVQVPGSTATYQTSDGRVVRYPVASEAKLLDFVVTVAGGRTIVRLTTGAPILPSGGPLAIDVHFSDYREVAFVRNFAYPSLHGFERAAVLDVRTGAVLGRADVTVDGSRLELAFDSALVVGKPRIAVSRYLPSREALAEALGGLERAYVTMRMFDSSNTMHSSPRFAGPNRVVESAAARHNHFGPPPATTNFTPDTPVIQIRSGSGAIEVVDHVSDWPNEADFDTRFEDDCDHAILCGWYTWTARVSFIGACGADLDGDKNLDGDEVQSYFGFCAFPSAINDTWQDASGNVHWKNIGRGEDAGQIYEYSLAPTTGDLGVWYSKDDGMTWDFVYEGPGRGGPGGWKFFPAPPPPTAGCPVAARPPPPAPVGA